MKKFLQKICIFGLMLGGLFTLFPSTSAVYADGDERTPEVPTSQNFLGLTPWYDGLMNGKELKTVKNDCDDTNKCSTLSNFIWTIALNVLTDCTVIAAYLAIGFIIYGGYQYLLSRGSTDKALNGKKTIVNAVIGLIITMCSHVIFGVIKFALLSNAGTTGNATIEGGGVSVSLPSIDANSVVLNAIEWVIGVAGLVAIVFIIYGGVTYVTSRGEPSKIETAKKSMLYALIGLMIVGLAQAITSLVASNVRGAKGELSSETTLIIAKKE